MAYNKTTWKTGDVITADKLNNIEDGISTESTLSTTPGVTYETLTTPTAGVWYKSPGDGLISVTFSPGTSNQFCQLAISNINTGSLDNSRQYDSSAFSQGANNNVTLTLPISKDHYYGCNWNYSNGVMRIVFTPFVKN